MPDLYPRLLDSRIDEALSDTYRELLFLYRNFWRIKSLTKAKDLIHSVEEKTPLLWLCDLPCVAKPISSATLFQSSNFRIVHPLGICRKQLGRKVRRRCGG